MHLSPGPCESPGKTGLDWVAFKLCLVWLCLLPVVLAAKNLPWDAGLPSPTLVLGNGQVFECLVRDNADRSASTLCLPFLPGVRGVKSSPRDRTVGVLCAREKNPSGDLNCISSFI